MKVMMLALVAVVCAGCFKEDPAEARSGVKRAQVNVPVDPSGLTTEQKNIQERLVLDNKPGSTKHLYVISAYSGDVLIYSTVRGKVTSSGKRLSPVKGEVVREKGLRVGQIFTDELVQDDGTYGSSVEYLYWWDEQGRYHQHYVAGGQIVHISDQPIGFPKVVMNVSADGK